MTPPPLPGPDGAATRSHPPLGTAPRRASWHFMSRHPAHWIALGFGSGLAPKAPGTFGTLWAWAAFVLLQPYLNGDAAWAALLGVATLVGWWACTVTARHMAVADPGAIVWDEVVAFWTVLWLIHTPSLWAQFSAFVLFRVFDAAKPGPVAWADARFKLRPGESIGWAQGFGILFDDFVAALCTLLVIAAWRFVS